MKIYPKYILYDAKTNTNTHKVQIKILIPAGKTYTIFNRKLFSYLMITMVLTLSGCIHKIFQTRKYNISDSIDETYYKNKTIRDKIDNLSIHISTHLDNFKPSMTY